MAGKVTGVVRQVGGIQMQLNHRVALFGEWHRLGTAVKRAAVEKKL